MNCNQAQAMLAAYRELRNSNTDTNELDTHLEQCASCRQALAQSSFIGEKLRALPTLEQSPAAHGRLMNALAAEHVRHMQQTTPGTQFTPEFLKPYLQEHVHYRQAADPFVAFSTADTGPLPIIAVARKRRQRPHMSHLAVIALAAAFLMVVMMSGITSMLLLAQHGNATKAINTSNSSTSIRQPTNVVQISYTTDTFYPHVVSAVADSANIYYSAYADQPNDTWMLEQLDRSTRISTPLLATPSASPLILLGTANNWLVWLQLDQPRPSSNHKSPTNHEPISTRTWSLRYLSLASPYQPKTLLTGTFNQGINPSWVFTPVQSIWFIQNTLLVATVDENGVSRLLSYQLDTTGHATSTEIATASAGHVFTSLTANSYGTAIYWADEWRTDDGVLHSNIWTQQVDTVPDPLQGRWAAHTVTVKQLFRSDGGSFLPALVDNTLFFLSTANPLDLPQARSDGTPAATPSVPVAPTSTANTPTTSWADPTLYTAPLDATVRGALLMLTLDDASALPAQVNTLGQVWAPQAGTNFVLWQNDHGYEMYDVATGMVNVGHALDGAHFVAVSGSTTVWTIDNPASTPAPTSNTSSLTTLLAFNWPPG